jgi:SAM-dependent methyltransferase
MRRIVFAAKAALRRRARFFFRRFAWLRTFCREEHSPPQTPLSPDDYGSRVKSEVKRYKDQVNIHDLPPIFHYWSGKYLRPMLNEVGLSSPDELFANYMAVVTSRRQASSSMVSIGAGNCDTEVRIAQLLKARGVSNFCIECLDVNPHLLKRGQELAVQEGLTKNMAFVEGDFNKWKARKEYVAVMASHSLHHVVNLEELFDEIHASLSNDGFFIVHDMIGRNGHQRWPEALTEVHRFWRELPKEYRYNRQLNRHEELYENWDCSADGFEGIRSQDILPLLIDRFSFHLFLGFANIVDVFIDRSFGHNFDDKKEWDREFIDRVHAFDEEAICSGKITPTHMMAVMAKAPPVKSLFSRRLDPKSCVRKP